MGPLSSVWAFFALIGLAAVAALAIAGYYSRTYGRVTQSHKVQIRGLAVPIGAAFLLAGLTYLEWGPFGNFWLFRAGGLACVAAGFIVERYYRQNYGRVTPPR